MLYFAYGSNLDFAQMRDRCPSALFVAIAKLPDHRLAFTRKSIKRACGVADAVPEETASGFHLLDESARRSSATQRSVQETHHRRGQIRALAVAVSGTA